MQLLSCAVLAVLALVPLVRCAATSSTSAFQEKKDTIERLNVHPNVTIGIDFWNRFLKDKPNFQQELIAPLPQNQSDPGKSTTEAHKKYVTTGDIDFFERISKK